MGQRVLFTKRANTNVTAYTVDAMNDKVLAGHLNLSLSLFLITKEEEPMKLIGLDRRPVWIRRVKFINDHIYLGADDQNNLFTFSLGEEGNTSNLEMNGEYHVGSLVMCIKEGNSFYIICFCVF